MDENQQADTCENQFRFPWLALTWSFFAIAAILFLTLGQNWLNEAQNVQPGISNALRILLVLLTVSIWFTWLVVFSGIRSRILIALFLIAAIGLFFWQFKIVFDGDLGFVRIESRFLNRDFQPVANSDSKPIVDLSITSAKDFNQFLGNDRSGVVYGRKLKADWNSIPPKIIWKKTVGEGWSGFSAVNGFAVTQEQRGQNECTTCYEIESGELVWIHEDAVRHEDTMSLGKAGPRATPTIHDGKVFTQGATGIVNCLNGSDGSVIWSFNVSDFLGIPLVTKTSSSGLEYQYEDTTSSTLAWGRSGSPLVVGDTVIVTGGIGAEGKAATLIALNKSSGKTIWTGGESMIGYGSPTFANLLGRNQIVLVAESKAMGFDPSDGTVLWEVERKGHSGQDANCSQVTIVTDDTILLTKGYGLGGQMVQLSEESGEIQCKTLWQSSRVLKTKMMSPVIYKDHTYSLSDGFMECTTLGDANEEARRVWRKRGRFGNGQLLLVDDKLLVHTESGELKLIEASSQRYNELGSVPTIDGVCWNTICLFGQHLLVRSELEAACIQLEFESQQGEFVTVNDKANAEVTNEITAENDSSAGAETGSENASASDAEEGGR